MINAVGPETGVLGDGTYDWPGDADLESVIPGLNAGDTNNASILEFDFVPVTDFMSFDFIFAAEEYAKKRLRIIPRIVRYIAYAIGILCSGYVVNLIVNDFPS